MLDTRDKKQFSRISVAALDLFLVQQILGAVSLRLMNEARLLMFDYQLANFIYIINLLVSYAIMPLLIFTVFYYFGKKPNQKLELQQILLALLAGNITSLFVGSIVYYAILTEHLGIILGSIMQATMTFFVADILAALAGLYISYTKRKKLIIVSQPELS